ncbi:MAG: PAC2 family protein, partial [Candidatus Nitrosopolaris sp.]
SVLDAVMNWALHNKVREVMVLDGIPVEGLPDPKRTPIILSSEGKKADEAILIHDYNSDVTKKEEVDDAASVYPSTAFVPGLAGGILSSCLSNGIPSKALLIHASRGIPDPEGAAILLDSLGKITENTSLKIDTTKLRKQGAAIKTRIENIIQSSKQEQAQTQTSVRDGVMYG